MCQDSVGDPGLSDYLHLCEGLDYVLFARANVKYFPVSMLTLYLIETSFNAFAYRADSDQAALIRAALSGSTLLAYRNMIYLILHQYIELSINYFGLITYMNV